ncbi:hypothetical protein GCM10011507_00210 [Edaphobacter acidisoli]|uniref:Uncharacterized protein n=1 Tax=Edaphobacter acidisoli TaxID=2040573 RepID=A0A916RDC2_9BACT|nr:hypothetical protein [Edaphobacter acidisoli]GGA53114.1 hypothetical protein GCM10011507_00210 [Edaphobacter acidisoli]
MNTFKSNFDYTKEAERKRLLAEEDRKSFGHVVMAAGVVMFAMFLVLLGILWAAGQRGMPLDHNHRDANALVQWPVVQAGRIGANFSV